RNLIGTVEYGGLLQAIKGPQLDLTKCMVTTFPEIIRLDHNNFQSIVEWYTESNWKMDFELIEMVLSIGCDAFEDTILLCIKGNQREITRKALFQPRVYLGPKSLKDAPSWAPKLLRDVIIPLQPGDDIPNGVGVGVGVAQTVPNVRPHLILLVRLIQHPDSHPTLSHQRLDFGQVWADELYLLDDYQPFDNPEVSWIFKHAFSGIDSNFGKLVGRLNRGRFVSSGEDKTKWFKLDGSLWIPAELADIKELMNPQTDGALIHSKLNEAYKHYLAENDKKLARKILPVKREAVDQRFINRVAKMTLARFFMDGYKDVVESLGS
ncbi:hypothetical protein HK102_005092, partial [Quaeritorhiza haematococci]